MENNPKLAFVTEEILNKHHWDSVIVNNAIFVKTKNWILLINNPAPHIEVTMACPTCSAGPLNPYILVGSGIIKGMFNCVHCATNVIVGFSEETTDFIKKAYKINQELIDENWKPENQNVQ